MVVIIMAFRRMTAGLAAAVMSLLPVVPVAASAATTASAGPAAAACCMRGTYLETGLHGSSTYPRAAGHAAYEARYSHRELHVRMWNLRRLHGRLLIVYVHGTRTGSMRVTSYGTARLNRYRDVARCQAGQAVRVRTGNGTLVGSGTFRRHRMW
jgi:hypothetical protein